MRKIFFLIFVGIIGAVKAQVSIGGGDTSDNEVLKVYSTSKGVLFPNVYLDSIKAKINAEMVDYLMVYNTNSSIGRGFYYWKNNQWNALVTSDNLYVDSNRIRVLGVHSSDFIEVVNNHKIVRPFKRGDNIYDNNWREIPSLNLKFHVTHRNNIVFSINGGVILNALDFNKSEAHYAIGLFLNNKLFSVRSFTIEKDISDCNIDSFVFSPTVSDLSSGDYDVKVGVMLLDRMENVQSLTFSGVSDRCSDKVSRDMMNTSLVVRFSQLRE